MPVWKPNPEWFREAVRSALADRDCEIELIVVDDGSPEPVAELMCDIDDPRLVIVEVPHGGLSSARNAGIARARGEALRFVDADDVLEPGSTSRLMELSGPGGPIAYGSTLVCDVDLRPEKLVGASVEGDALASCILGEFFVYIAAMLFPREVIDAAGEFDAELEPNEDYDYVLRALEHAPVRCGDFVAYRYRRHPGSITGRQQAEEAKGQRALERLLERRPELRGTTIERRARSHHQLNAADRMMRAGCYLASARHLASGLRLAPRYAAPQAAALVRSFPRLGARRAVAAARRRGP